MKFEHRFIKNAPDKLEEGILYVSLEFGTVLHKCPCGCGSEINTPLSPKDWKMLLDGETISLYPSVGNWSYPCQSHYWIINNEIEWAPKWTKEKIKQEQKKEELTNGQNNNSSNPFNVFSYLFRKKRRK